MEFFPYISKWVEIFLRWSHVMFAILWVGNSFLFNYLDNKLQKNILTKPLFDTKLFTKNIEELYSIMYQRYHSGLPADHIEIEQRKIIRCSTG